jgi:hypothetical protein
MKLKILLLTIFTVLATQGIFAQTIEDEIISLINSKDHFRLRERYTTAQDSLDEYVRRITLAHIHTALNQPEEANKVLEQILNEYDIDPVDIALCKNIMCENMQKMGDYKDAAIIAQKFVDDTTKPKRVDSLFLGTFEKYIAYGALGNDFAPLITRPVHDCEISYIMGEIPLNHTMYINATLNGNNCSFVLDTGGAGSQTNLASEKFAADNNIRIIGDSAYIEGIKGTYAKLGIADSMRIGEILYRNVAFTIVPGESIYAGVHMDALLGSVFMRAMGEFRFYPKEKKIVFPAVETPIPSFGCNMMLLDSHPHVEAYIGTKRAIMHFDTGSTTNLSNIFYEKNKAVADSVAIERAINFTGGYGGHVEMEMIRLPPIDFSIGNIKNMILTDVTVLTKPLWSFAFADGTLGGDFVQVFDKVVINYNKMFATFEFEQP